MPAHSYDVPTQVLLDQGRVTLDELRASANRPGVEALEGLGFDVATVTSDLETALARASAAEAEQERAKAAYLTEADEDRAVAEQGYRWVQRLHARVRLYGAENPETSAYEYRSRFRFGQLRVARARSVVYELRILIPEAEAQKAKLAAVGVNDAFIAEATQILDRLAAGRQETAGVRANRETATRAVREAEGHLSDLLHRLELADEAAALETPEAHRWFTLDIIAAERGRVEAAYQARVAARPADAPGPDEA